MLMAILQQLIKALFMITPTQQIVCSIVSRQLIADLSPTSRQPVADLFPVSCQSIAHQSPTDRRFLGIVFTDQSPIDLQSKNTVFNRTVLKLVAAVFFFSRKAVADRLQYMCDRGLNGYSGEDERKHQSSAFLAFVRGIHRGPVNSPHKWPVTRKMFPFDDVIMPCGLIISGWSWFSLTMGMLRVVFEIIVGAAQTCPFVANVVLFYIVRHSISCTIMWPNIV